MMKELVMYDIRDAITCCNNQVMARAASQRLLRAITVVPAIL